MVLKNRAGQIANQSSEIHSSIGQRVEDSALQISNQLLPKITLEYKLLMALLYWFHKKYHDVSSKGEFNHPKQLLGVTLGLLFLIRSITTDLYRKMATRESNETEPNRVALRR